MEFYELDTEFTFGKYQGKTLEEVFEIDPAFVDECLIKYEHFNLSDDTLEELKEINAGYTFSEDFHEKREQKFAKWEEENPDDDDSDAEIDSDDFDDDSFYSKEFDNFDDFEDDDNFSGSKKKSSSVDDDDLDDFEDDFDDDYLSDDYDDFDGDDDY